MPTDTPPPTNLQQKEPAMSKTIVITGASDGIGAVAARPFHADGHKVVIVGRSPSKTEAVARSIGADYFISDFTRLDDVRTLARKLEDSYPHIDVLANNAGGVFGDKAKTEDGFERTFQINHLAPFLLTQLLSNTLKQSKASVIATASNGARIAGKLVRGDLEHDNDFTPERAYATAKLYNILFTTELHRRYHRQGISAAAFHPGTVATNFARDSQSWLRHLYKIGRRFMTTPEQGASQLIWLAGSTPGTDWQPGTYFEKHKPATRQNPQALDPENAKYLWDRTDHLLSNWQH
jgi:NAD(P)-dependent dehydrogenase (short-subunit alcohol dehydrogenase family)